MFATVVEVTGNPDPFEQPQQLIPARQRDGNKDEALQHCCNPCASNILLLHDVLSRYYLVDTYGCPLS